MKEQNHETMHVEHGAHVKMWTRGVPVEDEAKAQLQKTAKMPFIFHHIAVMPDVHVGKGSTIGSVIPTLQAIIPAAVGVDIGCGMIAAKTTLTAANLPDNLSRMRSAIERAVPHGRSPGKRDKGSWGDIPPDNVDSAWASLAPGFSAITEKYPHLTKTNNRVHLGTLGTGNHFVEVCLDEDQAVWFMLHSGSRGVGNAIGSHFIELAKRDMRQWMINLPDQDLAYFPEGTQHFDDYVEAVEWAQQFAKLNREIMMQNVIHAVRQVIPKPFESHVEAVNCHHNYVSREHHFGKDILVTRKGAVRAREGELGIIPGSMGARSYIVRGLGNEDSFHSCSHGAGRKMSRTEARKRFTLEDHRAATAGVECRKDKDVIDETPARIQRHRCGHAGAEGPGRGGAHLEAGGVREGMKMIEIDGSQGEGGGQILRSSLSLAICTQQPFRIANIRANRDKPGLMRQHLTAVKAAAEICDAAVIGAELGSRELTFRPGKLSAGDYSFAIGTAGSCTLVLQTVLPPLLAASGPSTVRITGGTHNRGSPPFDFLQRAFLPQIARMGAKVEIELMAHGFYPRGGGELRVAITPAARLSPIDIHQRGERVRAYAEAYIAALPIHIGQRELEVIGHRLNWPAEQLFLRGLSNDVGPGNAVTITLEHEHVTEVITGFGEKGVRAETVAANAAGEAREYMSANAPVGEHLADQLLLPMVLAGGGSFITTSVTQHMRSNALVLEKFSDRKVIIDRVDAGHLITVR